MINKQISVLLNGWGGFAGTSIIDCLKNNYEKRKIKIVCTDIVEKPILKYKADKFHLLPKADSKIYLDTLLRLCKKEKINIIMPGSGPELIKISKNKEFLSSKNIFPAISKYDSIKNLMNKTMTSTILKENKISVPDFYRVNKKEEFFKGLKLLNFPKNDVCFKPSSYISSGGARGFRILRKKNSLADIILGNKPGSPELDYESAIRLIKTAKKLDLLLMEYLPGKEYSAYVFADGGKMIYCVPNVRERLEQFYSFEASVVLNNKINNICKKIVEIFDLSFNVNIQLKEDKNGKLKIVEINPRMGGSIALPTAAGLNLPYFAVKLALGEKIPKNKKFYQTKMIRYWKEHFVNKKSDFEFL